MLRKDAIYKIKCILDNLQGVCSHSLQSEAILNELERVGILPPSVQKLKKYKESNELIEVIENVNEWED